MSRIFRRVTASILTVVFTLAILLTAGNDTISQADTAITYSPAHTASVYIPPVPGHTVRDFSVGPERWSRGHRGVDLSSRTNEAVHAAGAGIVTFAGVVVDRPLVVIDHGPSPLVPTGEHLFTIYEPITPLVEKNQQVQRGQIIGTVLAGHAGCTGVCLHWGARWGHGHNSGYLNPWPLIDSLPLSLLRWVD